MPQRCPQVLLTAALALLTFASPTLLAGPAAKERSEISKELKQTHQNFLESIKGLTDAQWHFKEAEEVWSIAECVEHIAIAEERIRNVVADMLKQSAASSERRAAGDGKKEAIQKSMLDRSQKFKAPEPVQPSGRWESPDEMILAFRQGRKELHKMVKEIRDFHQHVDDHPAFGALDTAGWLFFLSAHTQRHVLQITEVKEVEGYPAD